MSEDLLEIGGRTLRSRVMIGSARYPSPARMVEAIQATGAEVVTVSVRRESPTAQAGQAFWKTLAPLGLHWLPNTAGCLSVAEAVATAEMARELFETHWIKLELIGDDASLAPDPIQLVEATAELSRRGFVVFPYCTEDAVVARHLVEAGATVLMPWGAPIGTGHGLDHPRRLAALRARFPELPLIVDAGLGAPSHAAAAMELGFDAVLLNTAIARAADPVAMGQAFREGVSAGRRAWRAGLMAPLEAASSSTPAVGMPFWRGEGA